MEIEAALLSIRRWLMVLALLLTFQMYTDAVGWTGQPAPLALLGAGVYIAVALLLTFFEQ
ncbi:hypothetical protein C5B91_07695 [Haloferax sp. Atlit-10N]|nr:MULTISPECIES: hypothetical protein [Haloferax]RDZ45114.1 hypothetical protein C5B87_13275 [Haloferax sp. Atlit-16N]RDZ48475.1 hypothetical protein C5B86_05395 [Haloferax sp. Atlit-19N]RDZ59109.1 hypothetical protein C5B91_07695 [Haloferax sp. Atlit-10N]